MKDILKRVAVIVIAALMIFSLLLATASSVFAQEAATSLETVETITQTAADGFEYTVNENGVTITKYTGEATELTVPSTIGEFNVTAIGERTFEAKTSLSEITLPDSIISIGLNAFEGCSSLVVINIGEQTRGVSADTFADCVNLTAVFVSENNAHLSNENGVLFNKDKTELIYYPTGNSRESYTVPDSVKTVRAGAFAGSNIKAVTLPNGLKTIEERAFLGCEAIEQLKLPEGINSIGAYAFASLKALISVEIPRSITEIPEAAFSECTSLVSVKLTSSIKKVGANAFAYCSKISELVFYEGLEEICDDAFLKCNELKSVTFPKSLKKIPQNALSSCGAITTIKYAGSESEWQSLNCDFSSAMIVFNYIYEQNDDDDTASSPSQNEDGSTTSKPETPEQNGNTSSTVGKDDNTQSNTSSQQKPNDTNKPQADTQNNSSGAFIPAGEVISFFESEKVTVSGDKNALPTAVQVAVEQINEGLDFVRVKAAVKDYVTKFEVYKLGMVADGLSVSPDDELTLKFKIPADYDIKKVQLLYVSEKGGASELDCKVNKKDGTISAEIISGGTYVLAEMTHVTQPMSFGTVTLILAAIVLAAVATAYLIKKAKQKIKNKE